jgi:HSP20 family protein
MFVMPMTRADRSFDRFLEGMRANAPRVPTIDVIETESAYTLSAELPGVAREQIKVSIEGKCVTIEAQPNGAAATDGSRVLLAERSTAAFARRLSVPIELDDQASIARFENGVLHLTLAKKMRPAATQLPIG